MLRKIMIVSLSVFLVILMASGTYIYSLLQQLQQLPYVKVVAQDNEPVSNEVQNETNSETSPEISPQYNGIKNILILGLDKQKDRSVVFADTIMIATIDNVNNCIKLTSLMRDMYLSIPGHKSNKINTSYTLGGVGLTLATVNENFDLNIEKYFVLDFNVFENVIDAIGGVEIELSEAETRGLNRNLDRRARAYNTDYRKYHITRAGLHNLNGKQALAYARIRDVGNSDFDRVARQQNLLSALFEDMQKLSPLRFPHLLSSTLPHIETNLSTLEILSLGTSVLRFRNSEIYRFRLPVQGTFSSETVRGGASALVIDVDENKRLLHDFLSGDPTITE